MQRVKLFTIALIAGLFLMAAPPSRAAQLSFSVNIGPAPVCPYGYFAYAPYNCAPYGYYGPAWFHDGVFIGAGRWFHGPRDFHGYVDRHYDPRYGYHGYLPRHGEHGHWHPDHHFHGNYAYDGDGHRWHGHDHGYDHDHDHGHDH